MDSVELNQRLSRINTLWTKVLRAHGDDTVAANDAKSILLERYQQAVYRYLLGAVRDADVAEELAQEFALRFVRGDFKGAKPERGRFRNYLKTSLVHLVTDYHRARQQAPQGLPSDAADPMASDDTNDETSFAANWRLELLERTWQALREYNETYHAALKLRIANPDMPSSEMAEHLTASLGKPLSAALVRKSLERAHIKFADLLLDDVAASMETSTKTELEQELKELDLLRFCSSALARRK